MLNFIVAPRSVTDQSIIMKVDNGGSINVEESILSAETYETMGSQPAGTLRQRQQAYPPVMSFEGEASEDPSLKGGQKDQTPPPYSEK